MVESPRDLALLLSGGSELLVVEVEDGRELSVSLSSLGGGGGSAESSQPVGADVAYDRCTIRNLRRTYQHGRQRYLSGAWRSRTFV